MVLQVALSVQEGSSGPVRFPSGRIELAAPTGAQRHRLEASVTPRGRSNPLLAPNGSLLHRRIRFFGGFGLSYGTTSSKSSHRARESIDSTWATVSMFRV